jgi:hypothetical protein
MKINEIFPQFEEVLSSGADAIAKRADDTMKAAKIQKKQAGVDKARDQMVKRQKDLADIKAGR